MSRLAWREDLLSRLDHLQLPVPSRTVFSCVAAEFREMAGSYLCDGDYFESRGDSVNALASWSYATGWLDAGECLGLIEAPGKDCRWIFRDIPLLPEMDPHLHEKVRRYHSLLSAALDATVPAPQPATAPSVAAGRFIVVAEVNREYGRLFYSSGRAPNALGAFSYGHAWLDAGVRSGLLRIEGRKEVFAV